MINKDFPKTTVFGFIALWSRHKTFDKNGENRKLTVIIVANSFLAVWIGGHDLFCIYFLNINSLNLKLKFTKTFNAKNWKRRGSLRNWLYKWIGVWVKPAKSKQLSKRIKYIGIKSMKFVYWLNVWIYEKFQN